MVSGLARQSAELDRIHSVWFGGWGCVFIYKVEVFAMRLVRFVAIGFALVGIVFAGAWLFHWHTAPRITKAAFDKIDHGMSKQQVIELLNSSPHYAPGELQEFSEGGTIASMTMESEGHIWVSSNFRIYVLFDHEEKVSGTMWRESFNTESFLEKLKRWFRIG
jgi:hypothetical protein